MSLTRGEVDLLDRASCNPVDIADARSAGSEGIVRYHRGTLPRLDARGRKVEIAPKVLRLRRSSRVRA